MTISYQYDSNKDRPTPDVKMKWILGLFCASMILLGGLYLYQYFLEGQGILQLVSSIIILLGGFAQLVYIINGYKPIVKKGKSNYLKIDNQNLIYRVFHQNEKELLLKDVQYVRFEGLDMRDIRFVFNNGEEEYLSTEFIQNNKKRTELENLLKAQFKY